MAEGRIQNRALLQQAANDINVEGIKRMPPILDLGDVKVVYVLGGRLNAAVCSLARYNSSDGNGADISGLGAASVPICGAMHVNSLLGVTLGMDAEIASLNVRIVYDGAGSTADAGAILGFNLSRHAKYGSFDQVRSVNLDHWQHVSANHLSYCWNLGTYLANGASAAIPSIPVVGEMGSRIIPAGDGMEIYVHRPYGGLFPVNTRIVAEITVFTAECQPQLAWVPPS